MQEETPRVPRTYAAATMKRLDHFNPVRFWQLGLRLRNTECKDTASTVYHTLLLYMVKNVRYVISGGNLC